MKTVVLSIILAVAVCLAGNAVSVGPSPPSEYNAHWRLIPGAGVGCVRDDLFIYGSNDSATMTYVGQNINLCGYDGVNITIQYSLETADEGDYAVVYLNDGPDYLLLHTFEGNTDGATAYTAPLDYFYGCKDLGIFIGWYSDETGMAKGIRIYTIRLDGVNWGDGDYTNIFTWDATQDVTGHQTLIASGLPEGIAMSCLAFEYGAAADTQGWWAVDNVELIANGESALPLQEGGYGVEGFEYGGWYQDRHGLPGEWEIGTDHATGDMSGANWQCSTDAHPGSQYQAETFSPWFLVRKSNAITVNFDTWFHPAGVDDYASLGCYSAEHEIFYENFDDLHDWETHDFGDAVTETSWGAIKAGF